MNKIPCASQNTEVKTLPAEISFLVALDSFHPLLFAQRTADLTLECSDESMFHPLSQTK